MLTNINEKLLIAVQNYFYIHNKELFVHDFLAPKNKKIQKAAASKIESPKVAHSKLQSHILNSEVRTHGATRHRSILSEKTNLRTSLENDAVRSAVFDHRPVN